MGIKLNDFSIKIFDVSEFNGIINWQKVKASGITAIGIRIGFGANIDAKFIANVEGAKSVGIAVFFYWYGDYYSNWFNKKHSAYGMADAAWGKQQADNCVKFAEKYGISIIFLDIENVTVKGFPKLTETTAKKHAMPIYKAFLKRLDELKINNGIYCSLGWIPWFTDNYFKEKPLWVAYYPYRWAVVTVERVLALCKYYGWIGETLMWQYASDGDVDDNGTEDGISQGMQYKFLDLNGWVASEELYKKYFGNIVVPNPEDTSYEDDETQGEVEKPIIYTDYIVTAWPRLMVRSYPDKTAPILDRISYNKMLPICGVVTGDGSQSKGWGKTINGYASMNWLKKG